MHIAQHSDLIHCQGARRNPHCFLTKLVPRCVCRSLSQISLSRYENFFIRLALRNYHLRLRQDTDSQNLTKLTSHVNEQNSILTCVCDVLHMYTSEHYIVI